LTKIERNASAIANQFQKQKEAKRKAAEAEAKRIEAEKKAKEAAEAAKKIAEQEQADASAKEAAAKAKEKADQEKIKADKAAEKQQNIADETSKNLNTMLAQSPAKEPKKDVKKTTGRQPLFLKKMLLSAQQSFTDTDVREIAKGEYDDIDKEM